MTKIQNLKFSKSFALLLLIWLVLTTINCFKAFHIDDSFHINAAKHLIENPTSPMTGMINWGHDQTPMYEHNQPPLFFYLIAAVIFVFGESELALHLLLSVFTFLALYSFRKLARHFSKENTSYLLVLFGFNPALIVNQNIMTDVPLLALSLGFLYYLIKAKNKNSLKLYVFSAILLGIGLLIKYSLLTLIGVLVLVIILNKQYKKLFIAAIPLGMLAVWSFWNVFEYGSIHLLDRPKHLGSWFSIYDFIACLGAVATFAIPLIFGLKPKRFITLTIESILTILLISFGYFYFGDVRESTFAHYLDMMFFSIGCIVLVILLYHLAFKYFRERSLFFTSDLSIVYLMLASITIFIVAFAPFIATRHILLLIPLCLLAGHSLIAKSSIPVKAITIRVTVVLGLLLGISDMLYANYYKDMAFETPIDSESTTWTRGLWGWQYYAEASDMVSYNTTTSKPSVGDIIIYPEDIPVQHLNDNIELEIIDKLWQPPNAFTFFSVHNYGSMYNSHRGKPAWSLSKNPMDTIYVAKVKQARPVEN